MITATELGRVFPYALKYGRIPRFILPLNITMAGFEITTTLRIAAFLSQIGVESGELKYTREIWGPTEQQMKYEPPSDLARKLGNTQPGDGYRFLGRGPIQLTGRGNYLACGTALGIDLIRDPNIVEQPLIGCIVAGLFWDQKNINAAADRGDIVAVTRVVNGGTTALAERQAYYQRALEVLH